MDQEELKDNKLEESLDTVYEPAPSFKDEMKAIGNFFKKLIGRAEQTSVENHEEEPIAKVNLENEKHQDFGDSKQNEELHSEMKSVYSNENPIEASSNHESEFIETNILIDKLKKKEKKKILSEEQIQAKKLKLFKDLTSIFLFLVVLFSVSFFGFTSTSKKEFCMSCHEMKPEYYTLQASAHSDLQCVDCHTNPGLEGMFKEKAKTFGMFFKKVTERYDQPITLKHDVTDVSCNRCHDMNKRTASPSGDLVIPHNKHQKVGLECVTCHQGVVHGKISERNLTKRAEIRNWNQDIANSMMSEKVNTGILMDECITCHKARDVNASCVTCHSTGMVPESHKNKDFGTSTHGADAEKDIKNCDKCHSLMTTKSVTMETNTDKTKNYLNGKALEGTVISTSNYIAANEFCRSCHSKRPPSHNDTFFLNHGITASKNIKKCYGCHVVNTKSKFDDAITSTKCGTCHPASHAKSNFQVRHPYPFAGVPKINNSCFVACHTKTKCASCHVNLKKSN
jgi:nitrate/TMAO reductase-like tetraheme cytochrome c subunit